MWNRRRGLRHRETALPPDHHHDRRRRRRIAYSHPAVDVLLSAAPVGRRERLRVCTSCLTSCYRELRAVVETGDVDIAQPPLFRVKRGKAETYIKDERGLE